MSKKPMHQHQSKVYLTRSLAGKPRFRPENEPIDIGSGTYDQKKINRKGADRVAYEERVGTPPSEDLSMSSFPSEYSGRDRYKRNRLHERVEDPDGYWILPHVKSPRNESESPSTVGTSRYVTPGGRYLDRMPRKHTAGTQFVGTEKVIPGQRKQISQEMNEYSTLSKLESDLPPAMTITFCYNSPNSVDADFGEDLLVQLQAQCRAYLAKRAVKRRLKEDDAVRIIQRNASLYFDPWFRLFLVLRPYLKKHRLEDEIIQLKSELEKFKAMVKVLRYENVAYQDKIARLLQLLDQMRPGDASSELVNNLVKELTSAVSDHQKHWNNMVAGLPTNDLSVVGRLAPQNGLSANPTDSLTDYQTAQDNAEFYRTQLEMLREEVDDQNARASQHYEEKIGILSERVEQLQNMLTQESFRGDRLNSELEIANSQLSESRDNEDNLKNMLEAMRAEVSRKRTRSSLGSTMLEEPMISAKVADSAYAAAPGMDGFPPSNIELINDVCQRQADPAANYLENIRSYLAENPSVYDILKDTPLGDGGDLDILSGNTAKFLTSANEEATFQDGYTNLGLYKGFGTTPSHSMNSVYNTRSHIENYNIAKDDDDRVEQLQAKLDEEIGYREDLEMEAQEMRNRIAALTRQVRRQRDEHDEEMVEKDQANLRRIRELDANIDELIKAKGEVEKHNTELQAKLDELRKLSEQSDEEDTNEELRGNHAKLVAENKRCLREIDQLQEELEQYKLNNNTDSLKEQLAEKNEKLTQIEVQLTHQAGDMEIMSVRLQNANSLLDENEQRLRVATKERQTLMHRISTLETERDAAVREAATSVGRAAAEKEAASARARELESIREERDQIRKEMIDSKVMLTESSTKALAEKSALEKRLVDLEASAAKHEADLKSDLERYREQVENLQQEVTELQKQDSASKADNRHLKRQITDLQDSVDNYARKVGDLERRSTDLLAELDRAKANLSAARETATLLRDRQTRANEDCSMAFSNYDDIQFSDDEDTYVNASAFEGYHRRSSADPYNGVQTLDRHRKGTTSRQTARSTSRNNLRRGQLSNAPQFDNYRSLGRREMHSKPDRFTVPTKQAPSESGPADTDATEISDA